MGGRKRFRIIGGTAPSDEMSRGSDLRIAGGKLHTCKLCLTEQTLQLSHVVPKWMYRWCKAEGGVVGDYQSLGFQTAEQDGTKHYLLCSDCEQFLGRAESYLAVVMGDNDAALKRFGVSIAGDLVSGLDASLIQRFLLGILLKAHHAPSPPFHSIDLAPMLLEHIRTATLSDIANDERFSICASRFVSEVVPEIDAKAMVFATYFPSHADQPAMFEVFAAGWSWMVFLNFDAPCDATFHGMRLRSGHHFRVPVGDVVDHRFINKGRFMTDEEKIAARAAWERRKRDPSV